MEVVTIEKRTFLYVCERFTEFAKRIESLCSTHTQKVENWLDSQEVCLLLGKASNLEIKLASKLFRAISDS